WLNEKMLEWLGEKNVADIISQSVPNNVTSEMGLALMDVADAIRPYPVVVAYFERVRNDDFLDKMEQYRGGKQSKEVIHNFLSKYGMRCAGEIDITRPRWIENLSTLLPLILANVRQFQAGE